MRTAAMPSEPRLKAAPAHFGHPWVDETHFPILHVAFPDPIPEMEYAAYLDHLESWTAATKYRYAWVIHPIVGTAKQRKMMADSQTKRTPFEKKYGVAYAFVAESSVVRGVVTAVFWLSPPPVTYKIFATPEPAIEWANGMLREATRGTTV